MLQPKIKLTSEEMKYMALFESITGATTQDCIIDEKLERIIFVAKQGNMGLAIGKGGKNINMLRRMTSPISPGFATKMILSSFSSIIQSWVVAPVMLSKRAMYFISSLVSLILGWSITFSQRPVSRPPSRPPRGRPARTPGRVSRRPPRDPDWTPGRCRLEPPTVQRCEEYPPGQTPDSSLRV